MESLMRGLSRGRGRGRGQTGAGARGGGQRINLPPKFTTIRKPGVGGFESSGHSSSRPSQKDGRNVLGFRKLLDILGKDPDAAVVELNRLTVEFTKIVTATDIGMDLLILLIKVIGQKLCSDDVNLKPMRNPLLAKVCKREFMKQLLDITYKLMQEGVTASTASDAVNDVDKSPANVFPNLLSFYQVVRQIMPTLAIDLLPGNTTAAKLALKMLRESTRELATQTIYSTLEAEFTKLESQLLEDIADAKLRQSKVGSENFQSRPSRRTAFTKGETERLYLENPPEDFRTLSVAPQKDELRTEEAPFLRPCIERGCYPSADTYLDVHFRLLREDFISPLREGIQEYLKFRHEYATQKKKMPLGTVRIYRDVQIVKVKLDGHITVYSLRFSMEKFKKLNWDKSKRLLTGSLLCLTSDNFQSMYLATVVFRRLEDLKQGIVDVTWEGAKPDIDTNKSMLMMECEVYYEAYRHTLAALQEIELADYPMCKYIVDANTEDVAPPTYLDETEFLLNFGAMYKGALEKDVSLEIMTEESTVAVEGKKIHLPSLRRKVKFPKREVGGLDVSRWPSADDLGMDNSQYSAFQNAITKELSVIQGPPGTGKTYIGLQITKLFLTNPKIYKTGSPILIVCYTNHALDQFLEGIIDVMDKLGIESENELIRIGSRSKSEELAKYSIIARMQDARKHRKFDIGYASARHQKYIQLQDFQKARSNLLDELKELTHLNGIIDFDKLSISDKLKKVCPINLKSTFFGAWTNNKEQRFSFHAPQKLFAWLGMNAHEFERQNFIPYAHVRKWFKISGSQTAKKPTKPTTSNNSNEEPAVNGEEGEDEYDMDELMAHRMDEIYMEMETTQIKREVKNVDYIISVNSVQRFLNRVNEQKNKIIRFIDNPHRTFQFIQSDAEKERLMKQHRDDEALINHKSQTEYPSLENKQIFLRTLMQIYYDEGLELAQVDPEMLAKAHNLTDGAKTNQISMSDKWAIYFYFIEESKKIILSEIQDLEVQIIDSQKELQAIDLTGQVQLLKKASFVGLTTTGAAKFNTLLRMMRSPIVIVEEAAEVLESHIVTSITKYCQHLILIGDHKQLRPSTNSYKLAKDYNLDVSLFERLINNEISSCQLRIQHRMRPNICKLLVPTIYEDLQNHPSVSLYPKIPGVTKSLFFISHEEHENLDDDSATKSNIHEANFMVQLCRYLILQEGYSPNRITIITTYLGQMFLLKKLSSQESKMTGVRITVVDNFQGEENDIILLSLVRSNAKNNIGFLKTDNRICVALSRAKHGMFVIGNMKSMVESGSSTWRKICHDLEQDGSIGNQMELKCEVHGDVTLIEKVEDFVKVPEGGCSQMCVKVLPCKHQCQSVCHSYDRDHKDYKCQLPCENKCPNDHPCKKRCYVDCGKCYVLMDKKLPCGHTNNIECHMPANVWGCMIIMGKDLPCGHTKTLNCKTDPATIKCHESVEKTLPCGHKQFANCFEKEDSIDCLTILTKKMPKCDHEVEIPCHLEDKVDSWKCRKACDIQLDCGHTCGKICHVDNDPDHKKHVCKKTCGRSCEYDHTCKGNHECRYPCPDCQIKIKRELPCGHTKMLKCFVDINTFFCNDICKKDLQCEHGQCVQKCHMGKECLCMVKVTKKSIGCGDDHEFELPCHQTPIKELCTAKVVGKIPAACGHRVLIPCNMENTASPEELLKYCEHPCNEKLKEGKCEHPCQGNCFACFQGRIHVKCGEKCGRNLSCGHICKFPCAALCPPCKEKCDFKCDHAKCVKQCGFPCIGCNEPCNWKCSHFNCNKLCREKCDRKPCDMACAMTLPCGHPCIGLCGELCPPLCRECNADEVKTILFGDEDEPNARFIYLKDCNHIVEVKGMDRHMTTAVVENGVSVKKCPWCTSIIRSCKRYGGILSEGRKDVVEIKKRINGADKKMQNKLWNMATTLQESIDQHQPYLKDFCTFLQRKSYTVEIKNTKKGKHWQTIIHLEKVDQYLFESLDNMMSWWSEAVKGLKVADKFKQEDLTNLTRRYENFFGELMKRLLPLTQQEIADFEKELQRILAWQKLYRRAAIENISSFPAAPYMLTQVREYLLKMEYTTFTPSVKEQFLKYLQGLDTVIIKNVKTWKAEEENLKARQSIFRAVGFGAQHWYKCPSGHLYVIEDCGQPNQSSICPECKTPIGAAQYHVLASGNTRATEAEANPQSVPTRAIPNIDFLVQESDN